MAGERKERLPGNRATPEWIKQKVLGLIREDWSPKQISGYLKKQENIAVSHENRLKIIPMRISKKSGTNQTEDLERNWILIHQKMSFTNI